MPIISCWISRLELVVVVSCVGCCVHDTRYRPKISTTTHVSLQQCSCWLYVFASNVDRGGDIPY